jgi:hypothetical protein
MKSTTLAPVPVLQEPTASTASTALAIVEVERTAPAMHAATLQHAIKVPALLGGWAERAGTSSMDTARLFAFGMNLQTWGELIEMHQAVVQRLMLQQQALLQGMAAWNRERAEIKAANTVTKVVEQEFNLIGQISVLLSDQMTNFVALQENIGISYAFWLNQKLGPLSATAH